MQVQQGRRGPDVTLWVTESMKRVKETERVTGSRKRECEGRRHVTPQGSDLFGNCEMVVQA